MSSDKVIQNLLQHRLRIRHLVLVKAIADHRSISKAAAALYITQSAATKTLRELEEVLGVGLFDRTSRGVTPTAFGEALLHHAEGILNAVHSASDDIAALKSGAAGRIVIGILRAAAPNLLPDAFMQARERYPELTISVVAGTYDALSPSLRAGEIDFLLGYLSESRPRQGMQQERLYLEEAAVVTRKGHPLAKHRRLELGHLAEQQWILPVENSVLRRYVNASFRAAGYEPPRSVIESHSTTLVQSFLLKSDMLAALPFQIAAQLERFGMVSILKVTIGGGGLPVGITTCADRPSKPAAHRLLELLRHVARTDAAAARYER
jgi:DNA-binding transcriptional LysR family regulator